MTLPAALGCLPVRLSCRSWRRCLRWWHSVVASDWTIPARSWSPNLCKIFKSRGEISFHFRGAMQRLKCHLAERSEGNSIFCRGPSDAMPKNIFSLFAPYSSANLFMCALHIRNDCYGEKNGITIDHTTALKAILAAFIALSSTSAEIYANRKTQSFRGGEKRLKDFRRLIGKPRSGWLRLTCGIRRQGTALKAGGFAASRRIFILFGSFD